MCSPSLQSVQALQVGVGGNDDSGRSRLFSLAGAESECGNLGSLQSQNGALEKRGQHNRERALLGAAGALNWIHPTQCWGEGGRDDVWGKQPGKIRGCSR